MRTDTAIQLLDQTKPQLSSVRAAVYVRISEDREGAGLGVQRQEEDCRALCDRKGWSVVDVYVDNDVSATSSKPRPAWQRLLADVKAGHIDAIVGWHVDRLTRQPRELEDIIDLHEKLGTQLGTATGEIDLGTPTGRMIARVLGAAARHEVEHKSERQRSRNMQAAKAGKPHKTGRRPFGYLVDAVTAHPYEAPLVAECARRVLAGESLMSVTKWLNGQGVSTTMGNPWSYTALRQVLIGARLSGRREVGVSSAKRLGEIVAVDCWDAIISVEQSDKLRILLTSNRRGRGTSTRKHALSGLLICGECGATMGSATRATTKPRGAADQMYRCNSSARALDGSTGCGRMTVTRHNAEAHVFDMALRVIDSPELMSKLAQRADVDDTLVEQIEHDERELVDIASDRAQGAITRSEWAVMRETVQARLTLNRTKLAKQTSTDALTFLDGDGSLRERFDRLNVNQQRAVLSTVLSCVRIVRGKPGHVFDINRLQPEWRV